MKKLPDDQFNFDAFAWHAFGVVLMALSMIPIIIILFITGISGASIGFAALSAFLFPLGVFVFGYYERKQKKEAELEDKNSPARRKLDRKKKKAQDKIMAASACGKSLVQGIRRHGMRKYIVLLVISIAITAPFFYFDPAGPPAVIMYIVLGIILILAVISFFAGAYSRIAKQIEQSGIDYEEADEDYRNGRVFAHGTDAVVIGQKYTFCRKGRRGYFLCNSDILWIYPIRNTTNQYINGVYAGQIITHAVGLGISDGRLLQFACKEFGNELIMSEYAKQRISAVFGHSDNIANLFMRDIHEFADIARSNSFAEEYLKMLEAENAYT